MMAVEMERKEIVLSCLADRWTGAVVTFGQLFRYM